jgi:type IV pilus assembly protein PilA
MAYTPPPGEPPPGPPQHGPGPWGHLQPTPPPQGYGYPPPKSSGVPGYVIAIIVVVLVLPVLGILASLGIYGTRRYLQNAKTAEAKNTVGAIARAAVGAFERERPDGVSYQLCGESSAVPREVPAGRKYMPAPGDFDGDERTGWKCLKFTIETPIYYQYQYRRSNFIGRNAADVVFQAVAIGDLDADGTHSTFVSGYAQYRPGTLTRPEQLDIENEFE